MSRYLSVDRIENEIAACEMDDRSMRMIPLSKLPGGVSEGDVLYESGGTYMVDRTETMRRREQNRLLLKKLMAPDDPEP